MGEGEGKPCLRLLLTENLLPCVCDALVALHDLLVVVRIVSLVVVSLVCPVPKLDVLNDVISSYIFIGMLCKLLSGTFQAVLDVVGGCTTAAINVSCWDTNACC